MLQNVIGCISYGGKSKSTAFNNVIQKEICSLKLVNSKTTFLVVGFQIEINRLLYVQCKQVSFCVYQMREFHTSSYSVRVCLTWGIHLTVEKQKLGNVHVCLVNIYKRQSLEN